VCQPVGQPIDQNDDSNKKEQIGEVKAERSPLPESNIEKIAEIPDRQILQTVCQRKKDLAEIEAPVDLISCEEVVVPDKPAG